MNYRPGRLVRAIVPVALLFAALSSLPASASPTPVALRTGEAAYEDFEASQRANYTRINAEYASARKAAPKDLSLAIAQCTFIENFVYAEDIDWFEEASDDLDACKLSIEKTWPIDPEAQVYQFESASGDDAVETGKKLWKSGKEWPAPLRARIASRLQSLLSHEDEEEAGRYALIAANLGEQSQVASAISHLISLDQPERAVKLARSAPPAKESWQARQRVKALGELKDKSEARHELERSLALGLEIPAGVRVEVYAAAGDLDAANRAARELDASSTENNDTLFKLAVANGRIQQAARMVNLEDEFGTYVERYARVVARAPSQAFTKLFPVTFVLLLTLGMLALLPGAFLLPVHYRGMMRRLKGRQPKPLFERIGLRHAWIACSFVLIIPMVVAGVMRPDLISAMFDDNSLLAERFDLAIAGTVVTFLALTPWLRGLAHTQPVAMPSSMARTAATVVGCWLVVMAVSLLTAQFHEAIGSGDTSTLQTRAVEALVQTSSDSVGFWWTLILIAVATPIIEEVVFRGFILGGVARHISFGWANTFQATLFSAIHFDTPRFAFYLTLGLLAGWLVRRYGRLWPAIALHALNNAMATWLLSS